MKNKNLLFVLTISALFMVSCSEADHSANEYSSSGGSATATATATIAHVCSPVEGKAFILIVKKTPNSLTPIKMNIYGDLPADGKRAKFKMDGVLGQGHGKFMDNKKGELEVRVNNGIISGVIYMNNRLDLPFTVKLSLSEVISAASQEISALNCPVNSVAISEAASAQILNNNAKTDIKKH